MYVFLDDRPGPLLRGHRPRPLRRLLSITLTATHAPDARGGNAALHREAGVSLRGRQVPRPKAVSKVLSGHLYAEYQIPSRQTHPWPLVMVHGGWQSGTNFTGTPDGREGWAQYFPASRLKDVHGGPARPGSRRLRDQGVRSRSTHQLRHGAKPVRVARALQPVAAGTPAHAVARIRQAPAIQHSTSFLAPQMPGNPGLHASAAAEPRRHRGPARENRTLQSW